MKYQIQNILDHIDGLNTIISNALERDDLNAALALDRERQNSINQINITSIPISAEIKDRLETILGSIRSDIKHLEIIISALNRETSKNIKRYKGYR